MDFNVDRWVNMKHPKLQRMVGKVFRETLKSRRKK